MQQENNHAGSDINSVIDNLIYKYFSGNVVPIIGAELIKIVSEYNSVQTIHEYLISKSFHPSPEWPEAPLLLGELPLAVPEFNRDSILGAYGLLKEKNKRISLLTKISRLKNFNVFLIASVFRDFEIQLRKNSDQEIDVIKNDVFSKHGPENLDLSNNRKKVVYLFDNLDCESCAIRDEHLLEAIYKLSATPRSDHGQSLLSYLENKTLLFLGCDFPDWFMRFCIRALSGKLISTLSVYIVNDHPTKLKYQNAFFKTHNIKLIQSSPLDEFVTKFYEQCVSFQDFNNRFQDKQVFISYSKSYDIDFARSLYNHLRGHGIDTYFDEETMEIGSHAENIRAYITDKKTKILLCVISAGLVSTLSNERNYVRDVEWEGAKLRNEYMIASKNEENRILFVPYFVDSEDSYLQLLPKHVKSEFRFGTKHGGLERLIEQIVNKLQ